MAELNTEGLPRWAKIALVLGPMISGALGALGGTADTAKPADVQAVTVAITATLTDQLAPIARSQGELRAEVRDLSESVRDLRGRVRDLESAPTAELSDPHKPRD